MTKLEELKATAAALNDVAIAAWGARNAAVRAANTAKAAAYADADAAWADYEANSQRGTSHEK